MSLDEWVKWGLENRYLVSIKEEFKITNNLKRDYAKSSSSSQSGSNLPAVKSSSRRREVSGTLGNIDDLFQKFIIDCEVPTRMSNGRGGFYWSNRFNKDAAKEFGKILPTINYDALVLSTKLYYKATRECGLTVKNYILDGAWRTNYYEVLKSAQENKLAEKIQEELKLPNDSNMEGI